MVEKCAQGSSIYPGCPGLQLFGEHARAFGGMNVFEEAHTSACISRNIEQTNFRTGFDSSSRTGQKQ